MSPAQWSRTAFAIALVFGSLPVASRILLGDWEFESAAGIACLCAVAGLYFRMLDRRAFRALPDPASMLDQANQLATAGRFDRARSRLTEAIRLSPQFWQAFQYRGQLELLHGRLDEALGDFDRAIAIAPGEPHLYALRAQALLAAGDQAAAARDLEAASRLSGQTVDQALDQAVDQGSGSS
jgi:predicted Zn-dependent protease